MQLKVLHRTKQFVNMINNKTKQFVNMINNKTERKAKHKYSCKQQ